jgi:hypothetical protein
MMNLNSAVMRVWSKSSSPHKDEVVSIFAMKSQNDEDENMALKLEDVIR